MSTALSRLKMCPALDYDTDGFVRWACTEPRGHEGDHIARGHLDGPAFARWSATPEDDGTEAESLAEVSVPKFPDVLVHGRAGVA